MIGYDIVVRGDVKFCLQCFPPVKSFEEALIAAKHFLDKCERMNKELHYNEKLRISRIAEMYI